MTIDIPQYSEPKSGRTSVSSFSNEKSRYAARPCKCKHAREIHSSLKGRTLQQSIWTKCNFPACECTQYSPTALISFKGVHQHGTDCKWDCDEAIVMLATSLLRKIQQRPVDSASSYNDTRINELKVQLEKLIPEVDPDANIEVRKFKLKRAP